MKASEMVAKAKDIALNYKTLYIYGCFGAPMNNTNKVRYTNNYDYNKQPSRKNKILNASYDTFGFDCVNLLKGILWGWNGNVNATYGGAVYGSNGVPDTNANGMFNNYCTGKTSNFSNIVPGEFVWMDGHIGVYIGGGLAVECTPIWKDGVQITAVGNIGSKSGYATRTWTKHGKCKFLDYSEPTPPTPTPTPTPTKYKVGDKVVVNGQLYGTAYGENPGKVVNDVHTEITRVADGKPYPYNTTGDLGWVAESSITLDGGKPSEGFKVGDYVVPTKLVDYKGTHLIQYDEKYQIIQKDSRGNVLGAVRGDQRPIWAVLPDENIKKVG